MASKKKMTMGLIVGNRGFFPDHLAKTGREEMMQALQKAGFDVVAPTPEQSKYGAVETHEEAKSCAELFRSKAGVIDGVIVTLPNFGDERAIADTLRLSRLSVPVLIQATPDTPGKMAHHASPRQFLRQNVRLQQSQAVRHSVLAHHAAHGNAGFRRNSPRISNGSPPSAASSTACAISALALSARVPRHSTPSATVKNFSKPAASPSKRSIYPKSSAASAA